MRKEIIYSLAAVAAIPVMANAAEARVKVNSTLIEIANASTNGYQTLGTVSLVKADKYELIFKHLNLVNLTDLKVKIAQGDNVLKEEIIDRGGDSIKVAFAMPSDGDVTISVSCTEPITITEPFVNLVYDFDAANAKLQDSLNMVVDTLSSQYISKNNEQYTAWQADIQGLVDSVKHADDTDANKALAYEKVYKAFKLSEGIGNDSISQLMKQYAAQAKAIEIAALRDSLQAQNDTLASLGLIMTEGLGKELSDSINSINALIDEFRDSDGKPGSVSSPDVQAALAENKAKLDAALNLKAFHDTIAKPYIDSLKMAYNFIDTTITKKIEKVFNTSISGLKQDSYTAALKNQFGDKTKGEMKNAWDKITALETEIEDAYKKGKLGDATHPGWAGAKGFQHKADTIWNGTFTLNQQDSTIVDTLTCTANSILKGIYEKFDTLAAYKAFADSVMDPSKTDSLFDKVLVKGAVIDENRPLAYMDAKYGAKLRELYTGAANAYKENNVIIQTFLNKGDSIAWKLAKGVADSVAILRDSINRVAGTDATKKVSANFSFDPYIEKVKDALDAYKEYTPLIDMLDSIKMLKDTLASFNLEGTDTVIVKGANNTEKKSYFQIKNFLQTSKIGLDIDSINGDIKALEDSIKLMTPAQAKDFSNAGKFKNGSDASPKVVGYDHIMKDIKKIGAEADSVRAIWKATEARLLQLEDSLQEVRDLVKDLNIYNRKVTVGGIVYGNYKAKLDSIAGLKTDSFAFVIDKGEGIVPSNTTASYSGHSIKALRDSIMNSKKTGADTTIVGTYTNSVLNLFKQGGKFSTDTTNIENAIKALKANYLLDKNRLDSLSEQATRDSLKSAVRDNIAKLHADSVAIFAVDDPTKKDSLLADKYSPAGYESLKEQIKKIMDKLEAVPEDRALYHADENLSNDQVDWDSLRIMSKKIDSLINDMEIVKKAAANEEENQLENKAAYADAKEKYAELAAEIGKAVKAVADENALYGDVFYNGFNKEAKWYGEAIGFVDSLAGVKVDTTKVKQLGNTGTAFSIENEKSIDSLFNNLKKDIDSVYTVGTLAKSYEGEKGWESKLVALKNQVVSVMDEMKKKQKNLNAYRQDTALYAAIDVALAAAFEELKEKEDTTSAGYNYYLNLINEQDTAYQGSQFYGTDTIKDDGQRDIVLKEYYEGKAADNMITRLTALLAIGDTLDNIPTWASFNKTNYGILKTKKNGVVALRDSVAAALGVYYLEDKSAKQARFDVLDTRLGNVKPEELYANGLLDTRATSQNKAATDELEAIAAALRALKLELDPSEAAVAAANENYRQKLAQKIAEARLQLQEAVDLRKEFQSVKTPLLKAAVNAADSMANNYNLELTKYPKMISDADSATSSKIDAAETAGEVYNPESFTTDTTAINTDIIKKIADAEEDYNTKALAKIESVVTDFRTQLAKDTTWAAHYRDSCNIVEGSTVELSRLIEEIKDKDAALKYAVDTAKSISAIDGALQELLTYQEDLETEVEAAAMNDLLGGQVLAQLVVVAGDEYYDDVDDEAATKKEWIKQKKELLYGYTDDADKFHPGAFNYLDSVAQIADTTYAENYDLYDREHLVLGSGSGYNISVPLKDFLNTKKNAYLNHLSSQEATDVLKDSLQTVKDALAEAIAKVKADGYAVAGKMEREGAFNTIQDAIDALENKADSLNKLNQYKKDINDSLAVENLLRQIDVVLDLQGDTAKVDADKIDPTLYTEELNFLKGLVPAMRTELNKIAANAAPGETEADQAAREEAKNKWEQKIDSLFGNTNKTPNIKGELQKVEEKKDSKGNLIGTAADLLAIQNAAEQLMKELAAAAGDTAGIEYEKDLLKEKAQDAIDAAEEALDGAAYDDLTEEEREAFEDLLEDVQEKLAALQDSIEAEDNILFKKGDYESQINDANKDIQAIQKEAAAMSAANKVLNDKFAKADSLMEDLNDKLDEKVEKLDDTFATIGSGDYANQLNRIANLVAKEAGLIEDIKEGEGETPYGTGKATIDEVIAKPATKIYSVDSLKNTLLKEMDAILDDASKKDINNLGDDLKTAAGKELNFDESKLLINEAKELKDSINALTDSIAKFNAKVDTTAITFAGNYKDLRDEADALQDKIDNLKKFIDEAGAAATLRGDINGDGVVDDDDFAALIEIVRDQLEDELSEDEFKAADVNEDNRVDVTDIIVMRDFLIDGAWFDDAANNAAPARGWFDKKDLVTVKNLGTNEGVTRVAIMLDNEQSYRALQLDLQLNGATVKAASLGERTEGTLISGEGKNGNYRLFTVPSVGESISGNEGAVVYLDIVGAGELTGTATFTTKNLKSVTFDLSGTTAIDKVKNAAAAAGQTIYNLGGRMVDGLKKGVNILRGEDGSAKKIIKK